MVITHEFTDKLHKSFSIKFGLTDGLWFGLRYLRFGKEECKEGNYAPGTYTADLNFGLVCFSWMHLMYKETRDIPDRVAKR